jgi:glucose uptake protein GlcU
MLTIKGKYIEEENIDILKFISRAFFALGVLSSVFLVHEITSENKNTLCAVGLTLISFGVSYCRKKEKNKDKSELLKQREIIMPLIEEVEPSNNILKKTPKN